MNFFPAVVTYSDLIQSPHTLSFITKAEDHKTVIIVSYAPTTFQHIVTNLFHIRHEIAENLYKSEV